MRAIVTGGLGFIGSNLCRYLKNDAFAWEPWDVLSVDDLSSGKESNRVEGVDNVKMDISRPGLIQSVIDAYNPAVIFHLAAIPRVSYSVEEPLITTESNVMGTVRLLEAIRKNKLPIRLVSTSSSSVYGGAEVMPTPETQPCDPQSPYAMQKYQGELWCKMYADLYKMDVVSLRYFNVFGPYSYYGGAYSTVLSAWLYHLYIDSTIKPFLEGDGTQTRDFCAVENVVMANVLAGSTSKRQFHGEALNIAQGSAHSLLDCKDILERISGKTLDLEMRPPRVGDVKHTLADISQAKEILSYNPTTDFENQVQAMVDWYRDGYVR